MPQNPFDRLIDHIAELIKKAENSASKSLEGPVAPETLAKLDQASKAVQTLKENTARIFEDKKAEQAIERWVKNKGDPSPQKRMFDHLLGLGIQTLMMKQQLEKIGDKKGISKVIQKGKNKEKTIQQRKSRFKKMGGDKWKRL